MFVNGTIWGHAWDRTGATYPHGIMSLATHLTYASLAGQQQPRERKQLALLSLSCMF